MSRHDDEVVEKNDGSQWDKSKKFTIELANCSTLSATHKCEWHENWQIVILYLQHTIL